MIMHPVNLGEDIPVMGGIGGAPGFTAIEDVLEQKPRLPSSFIRAERIVMTRVA
jgi:hypothetical protein